MALKHGQDGVGILFGEHLREEQVAICRLALLGLVAALAMNEGKEAGGH